MLEIINVLVLSLLGIKTLIDILASPDFFGFKIFSKKKCKDEEERVKKIILNFYKNERHFLLEIEKDRINTFLSQVGLNKDQFEKVKLQILKLRRLPIRNRKEIEEALKEICTFPLVLIDQSKFSTGKIYARVNYFLNFTDIVFEETLKFNLAQMMKSFIHSSTSPKEFQKINKIVIPFQGNYLFGEKVASELKIPLVKMRETPLISPGKFWEGTFEKNDKVIIINDVLVTGDQIIKSIDYFPDGASVIYFFSLINRTEWTGKKKLEERGITVKSILNLCDEDIKKIILEKENS